MTTSAAPLRGGWLSRQRDSSRAAFLLRTFSTVAGSALSLLWARLILRDLGKELYGEFLAFAALTQLGGVGDFGLSGAMGVRVLGHLARGEQSECRRFLAQVRAAMGALALGFLLCGLATAPWLPGWFDFLPLPAAGSLPLLFALGSAGVALTIINGYIQNLSYVSGNLVWPILPVFLLTQGALCAQWLLVRRQAPLWMQYLPHLGSVLAGILLLWWMLSVTHSWLAERLPLRLELAGLRGLAASSFWSYLAALGTLLYLTTDRLIINAQFGPDQIPAYRFNFRLCELATTLLGAAGFVAMPALARRLLSPEPGERQLGQAGTDRLQTLQILAAVAATLGYLGVNDLFVRWWLGADFLVPLSWQAAFAATLALTLAGDTGVQLLGRLNERALRTVGLTIGATGLLNLGLSLLAARAGTILGVAVATIIAQLVGVLVLNWHTCRLLQRSPGPWLARVVAVPLGFVALGWLARAWCPPANLASACTLAGLCLGLFCLAAKILRAPWTLLADEWQRFRGAIR